MDAAAPAPNVKRPAPEAAEYGLLAGSLAASWLGFIFFPLGLFLELPCLLSLLARRSRLAIFCVLGSALLWVPLLTIVSTSIGYFTGTARMQAAGLPGMEFDNLDPRLRCRYASTGCCVFPCMLFTSVPNAATLETLYAMFGPVKNTYHGPYPSREEVEVALGGSEAVLLTEADFSAGHRIGSRITYTLGENTLEELRDSSHLTRGSAQLSGLPTRAAVYQEECLLLEYPCGGMTAAALLDMRTGKVFAHYF